MLCGVYNLSGGPATELDGPLRRLRTVAGIEPTISGPLAVAGWGPGATVEQVDGVICAFDGRLYPDTPSGPTPVRRTSDADVVARTYRHGGEASLIALRGRFSVALWDAGAKQGLLVCDPLAVHQLFIHRSSGGLVFASELHELLAALSVRPAPDPVVFPMWLAAGSCPVGRTLYEGVSRLGPGASIRLGRGSAEPRTHWRPQYAGTMQESRDQLMEGLREVLVRAHSRRVSSDLTGVILSGGLDSSIVTAMAQRAAGPQGRLRTYSAIFPGTELDESAKVRELTDALGIERSLLHVKRQGAVAQALRYTKRWDMPLSGINAIIDIAAVTEAAADGAEVVLNGQTGDELFGFAPYLVSDLLRRGRVLSALRLTDRWPWGRPTTPKHKLWILREVGFKGAIPHRLMQALRDPSRPERLDAPWLLPRIRSEQAALHDRWAWKTSGEGPLWWRQLADILVFAPHRELRLDYLRRRATAAGVTDETPLYDIDLIKFCLSLPPEFAFSRGPDRPLARDAMRGLLPEPIRMQNQKVNFTSFAHDALAADAVGVDQLLSSQRPEIGAYVDLDWVRRTWADLRSRRDEHDGLGPIWLLTAAECWLQSQSNGGLLDDMLADPEIPNIESTRDPAPTG